MVIQYKSSYQAIFGDGNTKNAAKMMIAIAEIQEIFYLPRFAIDLPIGNSWAILKAELIG